MYGDWIAVGSSYHVVCSWDYSTAWFIHERLHVSGGHRAHALHPSSDIGVHCLLLLLYAVWYCECTVYCCKFKICMQVEELMLINSLLLTRLGRAYCLLLVQLTSIIWFCYCISSIIVNTVQSCTLNICLQADDLSLVDCLVLVCPPAGVTS
jgi:hypothetical protein